MARRFWLIVPVLIAAAGCAHKKTAVLTGAPPAPARVAVKVGMTERGTASWYGPPYHGRRAANGEIYDMDQMTAAHRTLPFDTVVEVKNLTNDRAVQVRITDRGPFVGGRVIDLSRAAATELGVIGPGTAPVLLTIVQTPRAPEGQGFAVQIGAFADKQRAEALRASMERRYGSARLVLRQADVTLWRVLVGDAASSSEAEELARQIRAESGAGFVVRLDRCAEC